VAGGIRRTSQDEITLAPERKAALVPPAVVKAIARVKSPDRLILASDAAVMAGMSPDVYKWGNIEVRVFDDGHLGLGVQKTILMTRILFDSRAMNARMT
jgi:hypothetical protein